MLCNSDSDSSYHTDSNDEYESADEEEIKQDAAKRAEEATKESTKIFNQQKKEVEDVFNHASFNKLLADNEQHFNELKRSNNVTDQNKEAESSANLNTADKSNTDIVDDLISSVYNAKPAQDSSYVEPSGTDGAGSSVDNVQEVPTVTPYTDEELPAILQQVLAIKTEGNTLYSAGEHYAAMQEYSKGIELCRLQCDKQRSVLHGNRAACHLAKEEHKEADEDCTTALELDPHYVKVIARRAGIREKLDNLSGALQDYQSVLEHDPRHAGAISAARRLPDQIKAQQEKMKEECMDKLKDLGNLVLKPFGLSTSNFNMVQDPNSGGYNIQFNQKK